MNLRLHKPLSLAIVFALAACSHKDEAPATAAADNAAPAAKPDLGELSTLKVADLDTTVNACQDLNGFVNNKWLAANKIPGDHTTWGSFEMLDQRSENAQKGIVEALAKTKPAPGSIEQLVGDFYASGMDEAKINGTPAATKLKPILDPIDAIKSSDDIVSYIDSNYAKGLVDIFDFEAGGDYKDSAMNIGFATEGRLKLPERAYYLEPKYQ